MKKRCEGTLERIDGTHEQCDNLAQHGSDFCWECRQLGNKKAVQLRDEKSHIQKEQMRFEDEEDRHGN